MKRINDNKNTINEIKAKKKKNVPFGNQNEVF